MTLYNLNQTRSEALQCDGSTLLEFIELSLHESLMMLDKDKRILAMKELQAVKQYGSVKAMTEAWLEQAPDY